MANKNKGLPLMRQFEALKKQYEEMEIQNTSFGLCLSALVIQHGELVDDGDASQYVLRLVDFQSASGTELLIETMPDIDGEPGTVIKIIHSTKSEGAVANGKEA